MGNEIKVPFVWDTEITMKYSIIPFIVQLKKNLRMYIYQIISFYYKKGNAGFIEKHVAGLKKRVL